MLTVSLRKHLLAAGAVLALTPFLLTAAPAVPEKPKTSPAEKLRHDLDQNISIEFEQQPIDKALEQLHEQTKLNFVLDRFSLQQMGFQPENMPVSAKLKDVKVKSALRSILTQYQLGYAILGDTVYVSTEPMAMYKQLQQRVTLDCDKEELAVAMKKLARETATNVVVDPRAAKEAKMEVSLQMEDVPLETAVRLLSEMAGLKPVRVGNVLFVTTKANAQEMRADPELVQPGQPRPGMDFAPGQPGGIMIQPGVFVPGGPGGGGAVPGIGTVPVNPPPAPDDKKVDPADKPDKTEKPDKGEKEPTDKAKPDKDDRGKPTTTPPPPPPDK
jgi:type II secretory pathway component GspD/PulD (secretin)